MCLTPCPPSRVWDIQTGQMMNDLLHHKGKVHSLKFTTDTLVTGSGVSGCRTATTALTSYHCMWFYESISYSIWMMGWGNDVIMYWCFYNLCLYFSGCLVQSVHVTAHTHLCHLSFVLCLNTPFHTLPNYHTMKLVPGPLWQ